MQAGKLVEQGTHEALLKQGGLYKELYKLQEATANQVESANHGADLTGFIVTRARRTFVNGARLDHSRFWENLSGLISRT